MWVALTYAIGSNYSNKRRKGLYYCTPVGFKIIENQSSQDWFRHFNNSNPAIGTTKYTKSYRTFLTMPRQQLEELKPLKTKDDRDIIPLKTKDGRESVKTNDDLKFSIAKMRARQKQIGWHKPA